MNKAPPYSRHRFIDKTLILNYFVTTMKAFLFLLLALPLMALPDKLEKDVVYTEEFAPKGIKLKVEKSGWVYSAKTSGRKRGALKVGTEVELVSFTDKAYYVRGKKQDGVGVSGWVTPAAFSSKDPQFIEKLKKVYTRQLLVRDLIAKKEIALGMTTEEAEKILGKPTKTKLRRTAEGQTQVWEFIEYDSVDHYTTLRDPQTGSFYRRFSHTTTEEKSKTSVEFQDGYVSAFEISKNDGPGKPTIVTAPVIFNWYLTRPRKTAGSFRFEVDNNKRDDMSPPPPMKLRPTTSLRPNFSTEKACHGGFVISEDLLTTSWAYQLMHPLGGTDF